MRREGQRYQDSRSRLDEYNVPEVVIGYTRRSGAATLAFNLTGLGRAWRIKGDDERAQRYPEALRVYERVLTIREKAHGPDHESFTMPLFYMAKIQRSLKNPARCEALLRRVLEIHRDAPEEDQHGLDMIRVELGRCTALEESGSR